MKITGSSIQQLEKDKPKSKCRKWRLWVTTEYGRKSRRFNGTYTEAQNALKAFEIELSDKIPNSDTFAAYAESWRLWREKSGNYSPNTTHSDVVNINALNRTKLSTLRMDEITPDICRDELLWLKSHPARGEEYSAHSMANFHNALSLIFDQAVADGKLARNPMTSVKRPKVNRADREALSPDEIALLLNRVDELPLSGHTVAVYLMACLGLRCGEACALRDDEVYGGFAHVNSTVRCADRTIGETKTEAGKRVLPIPPRLQAKVDEWRELRRRLGWQNVPTLCCNSKGRMLSTTVLQGWWSNTRDSLGCSGMVLHGLRHSNLSMMARHMSVFDLQRYAGWSTIAPAKIYVHDDLDAVAKAVQLAWA